MVFCVVYGEGGFGLSCSFDVITSSLLQNSCDSPSTEESTNIPAIAQDFLESYSFPTYPFNDALGLPRIKFSSEE
jgi:hypothetical protein